MKATGIVRRIEAGVIITPKPESPHKHWFFGRFLKKNF
jgi:hypothetical protein